MIRHLAALWAACALLCAPVLAFAQPPQVTGQGGQVTSGTASVLYQTPAAGGPAQQIGPGNPLASQRVAVAYGETLVAVSAASWKPVWAGGATTQKVIIGDPTGLGCKFSVAPSPASTQGVPFSTTSSPGSQEFADPPPSNPVQVYCTNAGNITVEGY